MCVTQTAHATNHTTAPTMDATPTTSTMETTPKTVEPCHTPTNVKPQPTGTVPPTCQAAAATFEGIPAGYETDDSWGCQFSLY